uniref:DUF6281 family protein n=1 Tax=Streptomyces polyasparticus TaxID=2767826 RepID=UPI00280C0F13|nr:DUF6281 family protein [Streptomyces polyasparticus]
MKARKARAAGVRVALAAALIGSSTACAGTDAATQGGAQGSCAARLEYRGHTYLGHGLYPDDEGEGLGVKAGKRLGTGIQPGCDDTPNDAGDGVPARSLPVYAIDGVDPVHAVTVDHPAGGTLYIERNSEKGLPELRKRIEARTADRPSTGAAR